jgi:hypothetical protein
MYYLQSFGIESSNKFIFVGLLLNIASRKGSERRGRDFLDQQRDVVVVFWLEVFSLFKRNTTFLPEILGPLEKYKLRQVSRP